ncbi:hypothetical protein BOX15_Mlig030985g1 [Macrostomum lignano]|uniref:Signal peptidase complex subunit 1 n=1 Tax=Macrostomum lignano TaxID=282301 RepID=A0A267GFV3_9PLAT|nr:hypothetical protein BOX15_Mlig028355g1 [Macrostomum lignano]PAA86373.1 hypothetical protein BOX15_Mlig030985g1 [Macrostomum lignano]
MDSLINALKSRLPPSHMDFEGQRRAETAFQWVLGIFATIGFACGYAYQQFSLTVYILGIGFAIAALLTLPPWPMYRRNPLKWQPVRVNNTAGENDVSVGAKSSRKDK